MLIYINTKSLKICYKLDDFTYKLCSKIWAMQKSALNKLIQRAQEGDKDAFGQIYNLFLKQIFRFLYFSVRNFELAEDLTQNTFFKVWRALPSFSISRGSFRAYLFAIARNLAIDESRKKKEVSLEAISNYPSKEDPEEEVQSKETQKVVWEALSNLKEEDKQIVVLRFFEGLEYAEIARALGKKEGAVRVGLHRILRKLRKFLKEV